MKTPIDLEASQSPEPTHHLTIWIDNGEQNFTMRKETTLKLRRKFLGIPIPFGVLHKDVPVYLGLVVKLVCQKQFSSDVYKAEFSITHAYIEER